MRTFIPKEIPGEWAGCRVLNREERKQMGSVSHQAKVHKAKEYKKTLPEAFLPEARFRGLEGPLSVVSDLPIVPPFSSFPLQKGGMANGGPVLPEELKAVHSWLAVTGY
jgi:hypothetical protein